MPYYHVRVTRKSSPTVDALELDLSEKELREEIVEPFMRGEAFMCGGEPTPTGDVMIIRINVTDEPSELLIPIIRQRRRESYAIAVGISDEWYVTKEGKDVTRHFIKHAPTKSEQVSKKTSSTPSRNIFIVHGRDDKPKLELAGILQKLGFKAVILSNQPDKGRTIIEKLEEETIDIGYVFVILTPDDFAVGREQMQKITRKLADLSDYDFVYRARQNVILELGYFVGKMGRDRVCCLYKGNLDLPSDIHGVLFKRFEKSVDECYEDIIRELKAAGYEL